MNLNPFASLRTAGVGAATSLSSIAEVAAFSAQATVRDVAEKLETSSQHMGNGAAIYRRIFGQSALDELQAAHVVALSTHRDPTPAEIAEAVPLVRAAREKESRSFRR